MNLLKPDVRQRYERAPQLLGAELDALSARARGRRPLVALDEVQRVPELMDVVQDLVDRRVAQFVLTGLRSTGMTPRANKTSEPT